MTTPEQVATIRSLGLRRVRWSPQQSDLPADDPEGVEALPSRGADLEGEPARATVIALRPEVQARTEQRRKLAEQRAAAQVCERQFSEAAHDCKQITELVALVRREASRQTETLSRALLDKMLGDHDLCIRVLSDAAGDKSSMHALNVTIISLLMGRSFHLPEPEMLDLGVGAMLHDIGKIELPDRVRHREEHFTARRGPSVRGPCGARHRPRAQDGAFARRHARDRAAPRACGRQRLPRSGSTPTG